MLASKLEVQSRNRKEMATERENMSYHIEPSCSNTEPINDTYSKVATSEKDAGDSNINSKSCYFLVGVILLLLTALNTTAK